MNNSPINSTKNSTTVGELADATSLSVIIMIFNMSLNGLGINVILL